MRVQSFRLFGKPLRWFCLLPTRQLTMALACPTSRPARVSRWIRVPVGLREAVLLQRGGQGVDARPPTVNHGGQVLLRHRKLIVVRPVPRHPQPAATARVERVKSVARQGLRRLSGQLEQKVGPVRSGSSAGCAIRHATVRSEHRHFARDQHPRNSQHRYMWNHVFEPDASLRAGEAGSHGAARITRPRLGDDAKIRDPCCGRGVLFPC